MLSDKVYNVIKWTVIIVLPAIATLYTTLAAIWGLPLADAVSQTICAVATFLGVVLGITSRNYNKTNGTTTTTTKEGK